MAAFSGVLTTTKVFLFTKQALQLLSQYNDFRVSVFDSPHCAFHSICPTAALKNKLPLWSSNPSSAVTGVSV